jgi:hypothetical protein
VDVPGMNGEDAHIRRALPLSCGAYCGLLDPEPLELLPEVALPPFFVAVLFLPAVLLSPAVPFFAAVPLLPAVLLLPAVPLFPPCGC